MGGVVSLKSLSPEDILKDGQSSATEISSYFNSQNSLSYETRENKKEKITEFYNLIYEYKNDCLIAAIEYNKDYYNFQDLKPEEKLFFKLTIVPFGTTSTPSLY